MLTANPTPCRDCARHTATWCDEDDGLVYDWGCLCEIDWQDFEEECRYHECERDRPISGQPLRPCPHWKERLANAHR